MRTLHDDVSYAATKRKKGPWQTGLSRTSVAAGCWLCFLWRYATCWWELQVVYATVAALPDQVPTVLLTVIRASICMWVLMLSKKSSGCLADGAAVAIRGTNLHVMVSTETMV